MVNIFDNLIFLCFIIEIQEQRESKNLIESFL